MDPTPFLSMDGPTPIASMINPTLFLNNFLMSCPCPCDGSVVFSRLYGWSAGAGGTRTARTIGSRAGSFWSKGEVANLVKASVGFGVGAGAGASALCCCCWKFLSAPPTAFEADEASDEDFSCWTSLYSVGLENILHLYSSLNFAFSRRRICLYIAINRSTS